MYAITGITGQVGGEVAHALLATGESVRAIVRDVEKGRAWQARGCEVAVVPQADDRDALVRAFAGARGVFLINPPNYDPEPGFPDTVRVAEAYRSALAAAKPRRAVVLSSVGAQVARFNLLNNAGLMEQTLAGAGVPCTFLRPAWFMENAAWDVSAARAGRIRSFLQPIDHAIDMVSVKDIGRSAADRLRAGAPGVGVVELKGPEQVSPRKLADTFALALGHPVEVETVPRNSWEAEFRGQGMQHPEARIAMLDGFNEGWLDFQGGTAEQHRGTTDIATVVAALVRSR